MQLESQRKMLLTGLFLALFFSSLDQTVVGTAMPRIIGELGGLSIMTWVTTAYMLTSTTIVPIAGKLADLYGRRIIYVTGLIVFMLGSALCGTSTTMLQLIVYRAIQGIGGGIMMPLAMTIVGDIFPPEQRGKWQGYMGALFGLSSVVGPTIGGWIVDYSSWEWVFYINLPIGILATLTIYLGLKGEKRLTDKVVIDYAGVISLIAGTVSLLLGLNLGGTNYPWGSWPILALFGISVIAWLLFIRVEKKAVDPVLSLELFQNRVFTITNLIGFLMGLGMFGSLTFLPLFLQGVIGISATSAGNTILPMMFSLMITSIIAGRFAARFSFRSIYMSSMLLMAAGFYLLSTMTVDTTQFTAITYIIILGVGMGLVMPMITIAVQSAFSAERRGVATAAAQFFRSIGGTLGITVLGVMFNGYSKNILERDLFPAIQGVSGLTTGPLAAMFEKARSDPHGLFNILLSPETIKMMPENVREVLLPSLKITLAESLQVVFWGAMLFSIIGIFVSLAMGDARIEKKAKRPLTEEAGVTLFTEGIAPEVEFSAEIVPDLIDNPKDDTK